MNFNPIFLPNSIIFKFIFKQFTGLKPAGMSRLLGFTMIATRLFTLVNQKLTFSVHLSYG